MVNLQRILEFFRKDPSLVDLRENLRVESFREDSPISISGMKEYIRELGLDTLTPEERRVFIYKSNFNVDNLDYRFNTPEDVEICYRKTVSFKNFSKHHSSYFEKMYSRMKTKFDAWNKGYLKGSEERTELSVA